MKAPLQMSSSDSEVYVILIYATGGEQTFVAPRARFCRATASHLNSSLNLRLIMASRQKNSQEGVHDTRGY